MAEGLTSMTEQTSPPTRGVTLAPGVVLTRLPFGGAVLMNENTLALAECGETDAELLRRLLAGEQPARDDVAALRAVGDLISSQWLAVTDEVK